MANVSTSDDLSVRVSTPQQSIELEGTTKFQSYPTTTYRYALTLKSDKLRVWIENCQSKNQWCTSDLKPEVYINLDNIIPKAQVSDYVKAFHELLSADIKDANELSRSFQQVKSGVFRLEMSMKLKYTSQTQVAKYSFDLAPISVERIDVLESKIRDLQDEMEILRNKTFDVIANVLHAEATSKIGKSLTILWQKVDAGCNVDGVDGIIRHLETGTYQVNVFVNHAPPRPEEDSDNSNSDSSDADDDEVLDNCTFQLMKGAECIDKGYCVNESEVKCSASLVSVVRIEKGEELSVQCVTKLLGSSYITLIRLD